MTPRLDMTRGRLYRVGFFSAQHRKWVVPVWVCAVALVGWAAVAARGHTNNDFDIPGTESQRGLDVLEERFPGADDANAVVVLHARRGTLDDPATQDAVGAALRRARSLPHVRTVTEPDSTPGTLSRDGRTAMVTVDYDTSIAALGAPAARRLQRTMDEFESGTLQIEVTGGLVELTKPAQTGGSEVIGLVAAILILLLLFGSLLAMGLPILTALAGLLTGLSLVLLLAKIIDVPVSGPVVGIMLGLGVGIDYSLFIVSRYREFVAEPQADAPGNANGQPDRDTSAEVAHAVATSGRAVLVAGTTVIVAMLGLLVVDIPIVSAIAYTAAVVVAVMMAAALTFLPAMLGFAGRHVFGVRIPFLHRRAVGAAADSPFWSRWARHVTHHAAPYLVAALVLLLALASPVLWMRLGPATADSEPKSSPSRRAYDLVTEAFGPGYNDQILLVAEVTPRAGQTAEQVEAGLATVVHAVELTRGVAAVSPPQLNAAGNAAIITVTPTTDAISPKTPRLVRTLRASTLPKATQGTGTTVYVSGLAAAFVDLDERLGSRLLPFILTVVGIAFVLLMVVFRSLFIPFKAAVLNVLSISASYGVIVAVFQWGWGLSLLGTDETMPIVSFVPISMFAILFGLSMDYEVFILTRVHEEYLRSGDNAAAVAAGLAKTARLVTSAAGIMILVFLAFVRVDDAVVKMFGLGLAVAVLIDATVTRMIMVPAAMELAGRANWWLPRWLDRALPNLHIEDATSEPEAVSDERGDD